jgi:hypothetical protein
MKWVMVAAAIALVIGSARADITDANVVDHLIVEKTKAQALVLQLKTSFESRDPQYSLGRQKYAAAQQAYNNYTMAMLNNYKVGNKADLKGSAQLAASRAKEFENYVSSLNLPGGKGAAVFVVAVALIEIGEKLFTFFKNTQDNARTKIAEATAPLVTWDDWDKIGSH